jgi:DNA repair protein RecN (Recombination protein N)
MARLARLEIEDFALIARASVEFADGFTVFTGETGSGKTMLLGALAFVLGDRASADVVRAGALRARVALEVDVDAALRARLRDAGLDDGGESAIFLREMLSGGKSTARVNGTLVTAAQLRDLGEDLLERVGQHEHQRLLSRSYQLDVLDAFAGDDALGCRAELARAYERAGVLERSLRELADDGGRALAELEFARFAGGEIDDVEPLEGEDETLRERRDYLANVEKISAALGRAHEALAAGEGSALEALGAVAAGLAEIARYAPDLSALAATAGALQSDASDAAIAIARELDRAEFDPQELEAVTARLDRIERLKKKYGGTIAAVLAARTRFAETIAHVATRDERHAELEASLAAARAGVERHAGELSERRVRAARVLEQAVAAELAGLAMPAARFAVALEPLPQIGPSGAETAQFALSANPGEPLRPLARAASGGELSRVLLAVVVVLADRRERTALVFDEIDAGIGGAAAGAVGVRIATLAARSQVMCVTHLAQIASWADRHYALRKHEREAATTIEVVTLGERGAALEEIARMLSGTSKGVALEHAETLVREARSRKSKAKLSA